MRRVRVWLNWVIIFFFFFFLAFYPDPWRTIYGILFDWQTLLAGGLVGFSVWATLNVDSKTRRRDQEIVDSQVSTLAIEINQIANQLSTVQGLLDDADFEKTQNPPKTDAAKEALIRLSSLPQSKFLTNENLEFFKLPPDFIQLVLKFHYDLDDIVDRFGVTSAPTDADAAVLDTTRLSGRISQSLELSVLPVEFAQQQVGEALTFDWVPDAT